MFKSGIRSPFSDHFAVVASGNMTAVSPAVYHVDTNVSGHPGWTVWSMACDGLVLSSEDVQTHGEKLSELNILHETKTQQRCVRNLSKLFIQTTADSWTICCLRRQRWEHYCGEILCAFCNSRLISTNLAAARPLLNYVRAIHSTLQNSVAFSPNARILFPAKPATSWTKFAVPICLLPCTNGIENSGTKVYVCTVFIPGLVQFYRTVTENDIKFQCSQ